MGTDIVEIQPINLFDLVLQKRSTSDPEPRHPDVEPIVGAVQQHGPPWRRANDYDCFKLLGIRKGIQSVTEIPLKVLINGDAKPKAEQKELVFSK